MEQPKTTYATLINLAHHLQRDAKQYSAWQWHTNEYLTLLQDAVKQDNTSVLKLSTTFWLTARIATDALFKRDPQPRNNPIYEFLRAVHKCALFDAMLGWDDFPVL